MLETKTLAKVAVEVRDLFVKIETLVDDHTCLPIEQRKKLTDLKCSCVEELFQQQASVLLNGVPF